MVAQPDNLLSAWQRVTYFLFWYTYFYVFLQEEIVFCFPIRLQYSDWIDLLISWKYHLGNKQEIEFCEIYGRQWGHLTILSLN